MRPMTPDAEFQRFRALQQAIVKVTEALAWGLAAAMGAKGQPGSIDPGGPWSKDEWRNAEVAATIHGIAPLLWRHRWGVDRDAPASWGPFIETQADENRRRIERIGSVRNALTQAATSRDCRLLILKGCDIGGWLYDDPSLRPMADIDVLIEPWALAGFDAVARLAGLLPVATTSRHRTYALDGRVESPYFGEHVDNPIKLDVHTVVGGLTDGFADAFTRRAWSKATRRQDGSGEWLGLDLSGLATHLLVHTSENAANRTARFVQLTDLHLLARHGLDWDEVDSILREGALGWRVFPALSLVEQYFPGTAPSTLVERARRSTSLGARYVMRNGIARFSFCDLVDQDPAARLTGTPNLTSFARLAVRELMFTNQEAPDGRAAWTQGEVRQRRRNRIDRLLAWIFGRPAYRKGALEAFMTRRGA